MRRSSANHASDKQHICSDFGTSGTNTMRCTRRERISLRDRLVSHYKLLNGISLADVMEEVSKVQVMKNLRETVLKLQGHQIKVILLTDLRSEERRVGKECRSREGK